MAEITEKFNVEEVKNKMNTLETAFNALSDALSEANKIVNEEVNVGPESALFGELGTILLNTWNENASTFGDFHANFESWAQVVSVIAANNMSFTEETIKAYKDDGSTLTYKDSATGTRLTISSLREMKGYEQSVNYIKGNLSDLKDGDTVTIGTEEYVASEENGVITLTSKDVDKPIKILPDGTVKSLYGGEVEINGQKIITIPYTDHELLAYYGGRYGGRGAIKTGDGFGRTIDIDARNGRTDFKRYLGDGDYVRKVLMPNGYVYVLSVSGGVASFIAKNENGQNVETTYKDVAEFFDENCTSLIYTGMNGHNKVMTRDSNVNCFMVKDGDEVTFYDANLEKRNIDYTVLDESTGKCEYKIHTDSGTVVKTVENGIVNLQFNDLAGYELKSNYKEAVNYFDENCTSLTYIGQNDHVKTMTKDPNTGYFMVKDSDGTVTYYDANLNKIT